jgi:DNA polymerase
MSLGLDTRQRAMLQEMGVRVWAPLAASEKHDVLADDVKPQRTLEPVAPVAAVAEAAAPPAPAVVTRPSAPPESLPSPSRVTELVSGIDRMDWPALTEAIRHCQACAMCLGRRTPSLAAPLQATPCDWLVVGDPPDEAQERAGQPFVDEAGLLLDNMLRAVSVQRWNPADIGAVTEPASRAYLTHVLKCRPALMRAPSAAELGTCAHFLRREIALAQPRVILAMGRFAMQVLLSDTPPEQARLPLGKLRGQVWRFADVPVVVSYPPAYLVRNGQDKARAWADLCLARAVASGGLPSP